MNNPKTAKSLREGSGSTRKKRSGTRDRLVQCAIELLIGQGHEALTLDAVAHAADVSKGGLLYHFPNKEALIVGIVQHLIDDFNAAIEAELTKEKGDAPGRWLRAYLRATFRSSRFPRTLGAGLYVAASTALSPESMEQLNGQVNELYHNLDSCGLDPLRVSILYLAAEGLWSIEMFEMESSNHSLPKQILKNRTFRKQILQKLLDMTHEAG